MNERGIKRGTALAEERSKKKRREGGEGVKRKKKGEQEGLRKWEKEEEDREQRRFLPSIHESVRIGFVASRRTIRL